MGEPVATMSSFDSVDRRRSSNTRSNSLDLSRNTPPVGLTRITPVRSTESTPQADDSVPPDLTPNKRRGLRLRTAQVNKSADPVEEGLKPLTDEERQKWKGWVELESDPALFNYILRQYGVKDVKVQEILSLDEDFFGFVPKPIYGLIFLYQYNDNEEEEDQIKCPNHVWFANQTIHNACATIALMNIVMNVKEIDLGDALTSFKTATKKLKPPYRGQRLGKDDFIRRIHNSFARRLDMLNADLALKYEVDKWNQDKKKKKRKSGGKRSKKAEYQDEAAFHFIAYVPIDGEVWRLDGLQRQPINLGKVQEDWVKLARDNILQKVSQHGEDNGVNLLSLCKSPLLTLPHELAANIRSISAVEVALNTNLPDWKLLLEKEYDLETGPSLAYDLTESVLAKASVLASTLEAINSAGEDGIALITLYQDLAQEQGRLKASFLEEASLIGQENEQAARRKQDYTPLIYNSIKVLAEKGILEEIIKDIKSG